MAKTKGKVIDLPKLNGTVAEVTEETSEVNNDVVSEENTETKTEEIIDKTLEPEIKVEQVKQEFIMIGMTAENETLVNAIKENLKGFQPIEMTIDEMNQIVNQRADHAQRLEAESILNSDENVKRANELANQFFERWKQNFADNYFIPLKDLKQGTTLSWKKFNGIISTLDMYGHIEWADNTHRDLRIIISKEDMMRNKKAEIQRTFDFAMGQLIQFEEAYPDDVDKKEIKKIKTALKLK